METGMLVEADAAADSRSDATRVAFTLNGRSVSVPDFPSERLSEALRERLGARDVKIGCNAGDCGACTVLLDGEAVCACLTPVRQAEGRSVETASGLTDSDPSARRLLESFQDHGAAQCGFCTPGMLVSAVSLLRQNRSPGEEEIADALGGVLCRCTGYRKIIDAVADMPATLDGGDSGVGAAVRRLDGAGKVAGTERFGDDVAPAGTLEIRVVRSPYERASFAFGDLDAWVAGAEGMAAVLTAADIPGENRFGVIPNFADQPVFAEEVARYRGEAVAAVVGEPEAIRGFRAEEFPVSWSELDAALTVPDAKRDGAREIHEGRKANLMCRGYVTCGDPQRALAEAHATVEGEYCSGFVEHAYLEPEAGFAEVVDGRVEIHACTQAPVLDRESMETILGLESGAVRIVPTGVGGGFGAKLDLSVQPYLALATLKTGRPVRIAYSRTESMQATTKRHPSRMRLRIGATSEGRISGFDFYGDFNTGAYASWGPTVAVRVPVHASGPYRVADYVAVANGVHTNCPPAGAFRGFGVPQAAIAQESLFDDLAARIGMDALEFRILNALEDGDTTVCGQTFAQGVGSRACLEALRPAWKEERKRAEEFNRDASNGLRRGVGVAAGWYGCGNTSLANPSTVKAGVRADGTVVLHQGAMDIGQGANTAIAQIFATALGAGLEEIDLAGADTDITPDAGKTSASRQTFVSGNAAKLCGEALRAAILRHVNASPDARLSFGGGGVRVSDEGGDHAIDTAGMESDAEGYVLRAEETYDPPTTPLDENGQGEPYAQFGYAAQLATVEVDMSLGAARALRFVAAHDVGRAINPMLVEGQVQGGIAQGLGMALMEEYIPGRTENLHDYLIPTIGDIPPIETIILEVPDAHGPYGAKGLGEHALIPTAPALLNAIAHATGARMREVPVTPSRLRAAIRERGHG